MSMIVVEARVTLADPSVRDDLVASSIESQRSTREDEPGCLAYTFVGDPVDEAVIQVFELWESEEALAAHLVHENYYEMFKLLGAGKIVGFTGQKHRIERSAPIYGDDRVATASFD